MNRSKILAILATGRQSIAKQEVVVRLNSINAPDADIQVYDQLADLPLHSALLNCDPTEQVINFCHTVRSADIVIIYLPEFTFGVPGALNNALEWGMPLGVFSNKFVALITTSQTQNRVMQSLINEISAKLYPFCTMRTYYLPHNLGPDDQFTELQCHQTLHTMLAEAKQHLNKHKLNAVA